MLDSATISEVGSCGYWVETDASVMPIMTSDTNRYEKYPSFGEDFESYAEGYLTPTMMKSGYAWGYDTGRSSIANVVKSGAGKALALTGDVTFKNSIIPAKITAGDSYAEDQTWAITVTIPQGLHEDAVIHLLNYTATGAKADDSGIKIQKGKLSYGVLNGVTIEYKDLTDLTPGTYTIKRVMNMNDAAKFYYDVIVQDASGKEIASVKDVACPAFTTISSIHFGVKGADKAVIFDNYKLYPSGVTTDFELYDAATGMNVKGAAATTPRGRSTAYRLSWLNGTSGEKTYTVMAAYYAGNVLQSEKAVKTVVMKPGCDKVDTGIVDVPAGQSVLVYLKGDGLTAPTQPAPTQPVVTQPVATQPVATTPVATQSAATQPVATQPGIQVPTQSAIQPTTTRPVTIVITKPTQPVATVPVATQPVSTDPAPSVGSTPTRPAVSEATRATRPVSVATTPVPGVTQATQTPGITAATQATQTPGETAVTQATQTPGITAATLAPTDATLGVTNPTLGMTAATLAPTDATQAPTDATEVSQPTDATEPETQEQDEKKGLSGGQIALIVVAVLAVAGGGVAVWYFCIYKKKPAPKTEE